MGKVLIHSHLLILIRVAVGLEPIPATGHQSDTGLTQRECLGEVYFNINTPLSFKSVNILMFAILCLIITILSFYLNCYLHSVALFHMTEA